ncbi:MAG: conjugal transfer protein TraF, partial [Dehalococcoidales bacterium]|nr:conjugal transfer protein TraF [Dehalococcoidales bacterium]
MEKYFPILKNRYIITLASLILGSIFLISGLTKLLGDIDFSGVVSSYNLLPGGLASLYGSLLPWVELVLGGLLFCGLFPRITGMVSFTLILSFIFANAYALWGSCPASDSNCGCLGTAVIMDHKTSIIIDIVMLSIAVLLFFSSGKQTNLRRLFSAFFTRNDHGPVLRSIPAKIAVIILILTVILPAQLISILPASAQVETIDPIIVPQNEIDTVVDSGKPVFLYCYLDVCTYCQKQKPIINELEAEYGERVIFITKSGAENRELAQQFEVSAYPSMFLISGRDTTGNYIYDSFTGFTAKEILQTHLDVYYTQNTNPENYFSELDSIEDTVVPISACTEEYPDEASVSGCQFTEEFPDETASDQTYEPELDHSINISLLAGKPVFLFFYAEWCHYCQMQHPIIDELGIEYGADITFIRAESSSYAQSLDMWGVTGFPSMFLIAGRENDTYIYREFGGFTPQNTLAATFDYLLENNSLPEELIAGAMEPDAAEIDREIELSLLEGTPVFLFFYANGCPYCEQQIPIVDELEAEYSGEIHFIRAENSACPQAIAEWGVTSVPYMFLIIKQAGDSYLYRDFNGLTGEDILVATFDQYLETGSLPEETLRSGYVHHSCSVGKCYENCIADNFEYPSLLDITKTLKSALADCLGLEGIEIFEDIYSETQTVECASQCAEADTPREYGDCTQCAISETLGKIPGAGCAIDAWNFLGDLLEPHADCLAECAAPSSTWKDNYGHVCRDYQDSKSQCNGNSLEEYGCRDCGWVVTNVYICDGGCEMTADGAVCKGKCKEEWCDDGDECTIDWCYNGECKHVQSDQPGCGCENCDDGNQCTTDYCDENGNCQHTRIPGCCPTSCYDDDNCTQDWCDGNGYCQHARVPGCDKPDDNEDYSSFPVYDILAVDNDASIAVLNNGFADSALNTLSQVNKKAGLVEPSLIGLHNYDVLIIPSGGLSGLEMSDNFRNRLWDFVDNGGTLISFAQQYGDEYLALPGGEVRGYGWSEDQACHTDSAGLSIFHPILSGQHNLVISLNVDGFFTGYPSDAITPLLRTKNGLPVLLMYPYGEGTVIAMTSYDDMSYGLNQQHRESLWLIRDIIAWATSKNEVVSYGTGPANVSIPLVNPGTNIDPAPPQFGPGESIELTYNITNSGSVASDTVVFHVFDPSFNATQVIVPVSIQPGESMPVALSYQTAPESALGIWTILYLLQSEGQDIYTDYAGEFALGYDITGLSSLYTYITVTNPNGDIVIEAQYPLTIPPGGAGSIDFSVPQTTNFGIWSARYSVVWDDGTVLMSDEERFALSSFIHSLGGWSYQGEGISFFVTTPIDSPFYGSDVTFTVHVINGSEVDREITALYWDDNTGGFQSWAAWECTYCFPDENCQIEGCIQQKLHVPAQGEVSFDFVHYNVYQLGGSAFDAYFISEDRHVLGYEIRGIQPIRPEFNTSLYTDKYTYLAGENINLTLMLENKAPTEADISAEISLVTTEQQVLLMENVDISMAPRITEKIELPITIPSNISSESHQIRAMVFHDGKLVGGDAAAIMITREYSATMELDKERYSAGDTVQAELTISNLHSSPWISTVSMSVPVTGFSDEQPVSLAGNESVTIPYSMDIPDEINPGFHDIIISFSVDGYSFEEYLIVSPSKLTLTMEDTVFDAGTDIVVNLSNIGGVGTEAVCNLYLLSAEISTATTVNITQGQTLALDLAIPAPTAGGNYQLVASCRDTRANRLVTLNENIEINASELELALTNSSYDSGENIQVTVTNTSIVDTTAECSLSLTELFGDVVASESGLHDVPANSSVLLELPTAEQTVSGYYKLTVECTDINSGHKEVLKRLITISGADASLTSVTDKEHYASSDDVQIQTDIINGGISLTDGSLVRRIWQTSVSQESGEEAWVSHYNSDYDNSDEPVDIAIDDTGNIYVTGRSRGSSTTRDDYATVKYDAAGNELWEARYNYGSGYDWASALALDNAGNVYVTGTSSTTCVTIKYDNDGNEQWVARYDDTGITQSGGVDIAVDSDGNIIVAGYAGMSSTVRDCLTIKYNPATGEVIWRSYYGGFTGYNQAAALALDTAGNAYVTGESKPTSTGYADYITVKYAGIDGAEIWTARYDGPSGESDEPADIAVDGSNNVYVTGYCTIYHPDHGMDLSDYATIKYDSEGNEQWVRLYNGTYNWEDAARYIAVDSSANVYVTGRSSGGEPGDYSFILDIVTIKYSADGDEIWASRLENSNDTSNSFLGEEIVSGFALDTEGNAYITALLYKVYGEWEKQAVTVKYGGVDGTEMWRLSYEDASVKQPTSNYVNNTMAMDGDNSVYISISAFQLGSTSKGDYTTIKYMSTTSETAELPVWEETIPLTLDASQSWSDDRTLNIQTDLSGVNGKLLHAAYVNNSSGQMVAQSIVQSFYINDSDLNLTMATKKDFYYGGEIVFVSGNVSNNGPVAESVNLTLTLDNATILEEAFTLQPGESRDYTANTTAVNTFVLQAAANNLTVYDQIEVVPHGLTLEIIAPDTVGLSSFDAVLQIGNQSDIDYIVDVSFGGHEYTGMELFAGEIKAITDNMTITEDTLITGMITSPLSLIESKLVIMGEAATLQVTPANKYSPGEIAIPFSIENTGLIDVDSEANFMIAGQTIIKPLYVVAGALWSDNISVELAAGSYNLEYDSPYGSGTVIITVIESGIGAPEFTVTNLPDNLVLAPGDATWEFKVRNDGGSGGLVDFQLEILESEYGQFAWLEAGEEETFSFNFELPDDLEAKTYTAYYGINDTSYKLDFSLAGPKVEVLASLDKDLYEDGETAVLTLEITNLSILDLSLFASVNLGDYETNENLTLTGGSTNTLVFNVPAVFDRGKLFYGIYTVSGRALYLNAVYVNERHTLGLWTDRQVYDIGDTVIVYMDAPIDGVVSLEAPGYSDQMSLSTGVNTASFTVPELMRGTYYIEYTFGNATERFPFDVRGHFGRITSFNLDKGSYGPGDSIFFTAEAEVNLAAGAVLSCQVLDHWGNIISSLELPVTLKEGINTIAGSTVFNPPAAGLHSIRCQIQADISEQLFQMASAKQYFDAIGINSPPVADAGAPYFATEGAVVLFEAS